MSKAPDTFQRTWLDVQCSSLGMAQYDKKMRLFLESFLASFSSRKDPRFKRFFANGNELVSTVCKCFTANGKKLLSDESSHAAEVADDRALSSLLVSAMAVLINPEEYPGKEIAELTSSFEIAEENNVMSTLLELHENLLPLALSNSGEAESFSALDLKYLDFTARFFGCSQKAFIKRSVATGTQKAFVRLMATTILKCSLCCASAAATAAAIASSPAAASSQRPSEEVVVRLHSIAEAAARVFQDQVRYAPGMESVRDALDILETGANGSPAKPGDECFFVAALGCYTCLLESVICVRLRFGFYEPETVSFSVTTAHVLGSEDPAGAGWSAESVATRGRLCGRLAKCLEIFATAERRSVGVSPSNTPDKKRLDSTHSGSNPSVGAGVPDSTGSPVGSFFQLVPGTLNKWQQKLTTSLSGGGGDGSGGAASARTRGTALASPVKCPEAAVSLATIFVYTKVASSADIFGAALFKILRYRGVSYDLVAIVFNVCADNMRSLGVSKLGRLLEFLGEADEALNTLDFVRCIIDKFKEGAIGNEECQMLVVDFMVVYATKSSLNARVVLEDGMLPACLVSLSDMLVASHPAPKVFTDKVAVLSKVVVQSDQAVQTLEEQNVPHLLLDAMLIACRRKIPAVSVMLRDMFTNVVVKTGSFYGTLITALANCSESAPWQAESSVLLATLVATMQGGKFVEEAIDKNAVELCLSMVHDVSTSSSTPAADLHLLGSCLGFLLPRVCYSDVWSLFDASVAHMECDAVNAQFMIDLACGFFTSPENCACCLRYFETGEVAVFTQPKEAEWSRMARMGPLFVPRRPFLQLQHPLKTLIAWCDSAPEGPRIVKVLRDVMNHLLLSSEAKLPNEYLGNYILDGCNTDKTLLCCVRDVTAPNYLPLFFGAGASPSLSAVWKRELAWLAVLCPQSRTSAAEVPALASCQRDVSLELSATSLIEYRFNAQFAETGGATGVVSCTSEVWPSPDGYTVSMWIHWESMNASVPSDRKNVLWQLSWPVAHGNRFTLSLTVNPKQQAVYFTYQEGSDVKVMALPFIREDTWTHVTLCHHRGKLFGSQLKVYYDGVLQQAVNCPYPSSVLQTAVAAASGGVLAPGGSGRDITCTVGAPKDKPNGSMSLRFISFHVYNYPLAVEEVVALFCSGAQSHGQGHWDSPGEAKETSLLAPYLSDEVLRALVVQKTHGSLHNTFQRESAILWATPQRAVVRLHARSMSLVEAPLGHVRSNNRWIITNCTSVPSTEFVTHGTFIPPQAGLTNEVDALLSHGAMYEWVCWIDVISTSAARDRASRVTDTSPCDAATTADTTERLPCADAAPAPDSHPPATAAAKAFLHILAASNKQTELSPSSWRRLLGRLIEEAIRHPEVFLHDEASLCSLLSLSVRVMSQYSGVASPKTTPSCKTFDADGCANEAFLASVGDGVLYFTTLMEHVFFNWKVLSRFPRSSLQTVLSVFEGLLSTENAYHQVNALRFLAADFVNGFVCGMFREFVEPTSLDAAMRCVELMIRALWRKGEFLANLLTVCAVSTSSSATDGVGLGSRLDAVCPSYTVLVRNLLLLSLNRVWDDLPVTEQASLARIMSSVLGAPWFTAMTAGAVHPATVVLATRIFVICFQHCENFREQYRGERLLCLVETLSFHAHQRDVVDVVFFAVLGLVWPLPASGVGPAARTTGRCAYNTLPFQNDSGHIPFLRLLLHLVRRMSQTLMLRPDEMVISCGVDGPVRNVYDYFTTFFGRLSELSHRQSRSRRRRALSFRGVALAVMCAIRLGKRSQGAGSSAPSLALTLAGGSGSSSASLKAVMLASICDVVDWLALRYHGSRGLQKALYRSDDIDNTTDLLCWPLLCTLDARSVEFSEAAEDGGNDRSAELPRTPLVPPQKSETKAKSDGSYEDEWEDVGKDFEMEEGEDEDWELLPAVPTTDSRSFGLDRLKPRAGFESLYDSCRSFFLTHALERVTDGEEFALPRGRVRMSKFVLALHRALAAEPRAVGNQLSDCRATYLCSVWMKAAEQSVDSGASTPSSSPPGLKNVLSLCEYLLSRLVSGAAVPPLGLSAFFRFLLARLEGNTEVVRRCRTCLFEWLMYVVNTSYYKHVGSRAAAVVDMLAPNADVLFAAPIPTGDLLRVVTLRLLELTHTCLLAHEAAPPTGGDGTAVVVLRKLSRVWSLLIHANREAGVLRQLLQASGKVDLWTNGFDTLLQHPSAKAAEEFVAWLVVNKVSLWRCFQGVGGAPFLYTVAEGGKYAKVMRASVHLSQKCSGEEARYVMESHKGNEAAWIAFLETNTFVDPAIVEHGGFTFPNSCVVMANAQGNRGSANELQWWFLHQSGAVGIKELYAHENVDDLASEPISLYIRYPPPVCLPVRLTKSDTVSPFCGLRWNALSVLCKITGQSYIRWVGNVYYVVGNDSRICTLTVTDKEVVLVSCSEFTKDGDFFIAQIRPQTARQTSNIKTTFMQQTWRRLMTTAGGGQHGGGTATTTKAAFRYSQYYRQLRTEALVAADALVWRFPLGQVAAMHQRLFQHMPAGLEFVLETGEHFLVVVLDEELSFSKAARDKLQGVVGDIAPHIEVETMSSKRAKLAVATRQWVNGEMRNYHYLMALNDAASRTVADIGQYPVMPWVLKEYKSDGLDLGSADVFRDLTKPVGALNPLKVEQLQRRYREWVDDSGPPFHYGTHYSSGAIVLYYLIRLQPFTARSIAYQGGRLDIADRLFHSVPEAWENSSGSGTGDVKELIPEFFSLGAMFLNKNRTPLGTRRDGGSVNDVLLPKWAQGSPTVFTHINALALESPFVSEHLNDWIDLIFGYKQTGEAAVSAVNVFHNLSYQDGVEHAINKATSEENRKAIVASADNFGQTPLQLFAKAPHPQRNLAAAVWQQQLIANVKTLYPTTVMPEGRLVTAVRGVAFTRLFEVDHVAYGCPSNHTMAVSEPKEIFVYDARTDSISSTLARQTKPNASLPPIGSLGCGNYTCMCTSSTGNFLCVGTDTGKVVVFTRPGPSECFTVTTILHSAKNADDGVATVHLFHEGYLVVSHTNSATVTGWHISALGSMFSFLLDLPPCGADRSPVYMCAQDDSRGTVYGARARSVALFTREGALLRQFDLTPFLEALSSKAGSRWDPQWDISAIEFCNCTSFHEEELLVLGHHNGFITFWVVQAQTFSDVNTQPQFYNLRYLHHLSCDHGVTAIMLLRAGGIVLAGLANGTIIQFCYATLLDDSPVLLPL